MKNKTPIKIQKMIKKEGPIKIIMDLCEALKLEHDDRKSFESRYVYEEIHDCIINGAVHILDNEYVDRYSRRCGINLDILKEFVEDNSFTRDIKCEYEDSVEEDTKDDASISDVYSNEEVNDCLELV